MNSLLDAVSSFTIDERLASESRLRLAFEAEPFRTYQFNFT